MSEAIDKDDRQIDELTDRHTINKQTRREREER